jgi:hypothetical protein
VARGHGLRRRHFPATVYIWLTLKLQTPAADEVEVDAETLSAIDRGIKDADEGRTVSVDDARKMISRWICKFD